MELNDYKKKGFLPFCIEEIKLAYKAGIDPKLIEKYMNDRDFDNMQLRQIRLGLEGNLDVSAYARTSMPSDEMEQIRLRGTLTSRVRTAVPFLVIAESGRMMGRVIPPHQTSIAFLFQSPSEGIHHLVQRCQYLSRVPVVLRAHPQEQYRLIPEVVEEFVFELSLSDYVVGHGYISALFGI